MFRDLASKLAEVQVIGPAVLSSNSTQSVIDLQGFSSAVFLISVGAGGITFSGTNKIEFVLTHGDASDGSDQANVTLADVQGPASVSNGIVRSLTTAKAAADTAPTEIGYIGQKRYVKLQDTFGGTHGTGTAISAVLVKSNAEIKPV